jgi:molybdenum cofactor cytidylyltransferase
MICAILLAAGCSSRMGTQKLLLPFASATVISHIVDQVLASKIEKVYVVVGHQPEMIEKELSGRSVEIVGNPKYKSGMLSSVRAGLRYIPENCDAVLVVLGDQPSITTELIDKMVQTYSSSEKKIIVPLHEGKRGHPLLLSKIYRNEILTKYDDVGLRGILVEHDDDIFELSVSNPSVLLDMDYPEDYERELESQ